MGESGEVNSNVEMGTVCTNWARAAKAKTAIERNGGIWRLDTNVKIGTVCTNQLGLRKLRELQTCAALVVG